MNEVYLKLRAVRCSATRHGTVVFVLVSGLVGLGSCSVPTARGEEFFLKHRVAASIEEEIGNAWVVFPVRSAQPRPNDAVPLNSPELTATLDLGTKWQLRLQTSLGDTGNGILHVSVDRNGSIVANESISGVKRNPMYTEFGPVRLIVDHGGEPRPQWFQFQLWGSDEEHGQPTRTLRVASASYFRGTVKFGDRRMLVALIDAEANGLYQFVRKGSSGRGDRLLIDVNGDGRLDPADRDEAEPLSRYVFVGGQYWRLEPAPDGSSLVVEPAELQVGMVHADTDRFALLLEGDVGVLRVSGRDGKAPVPVGSHSVLRCDYHVRDESGKLWNVFTKVDGGNKTLLVTADADTKLPFGPPLVARVSAASTTRGDELTLDLTLAGAAGEICDGLADERGRPPAAPKVKITDSAGRELALLDFHYG